MTIERKKWERKKGLWQKDVMEFYVVQNQHSTLNNTQLGITMFQ